MNRYQPITGIDCTPAALLIDTLAPLDVRHENAAQRIRTVTQWLEQLAADAHRSNDTMVPRDIAQLLAITLRDGCDLLDVIGRRLQASPTPERRFGMRQD